MKKYRKVEWLVLILFVFVAGIYYYGLHRSFWPDPESIYMTLKYFYGDKFGVQVSKHFFITDALAFVSYKLFGAGYRGIRVYYSLTYMLILGFTSLFAIWNPKEKNIKWHLLPMLAYITVILNPGDSEFCGYHTDAYHVYPYDMHTDSVIKILIATFIVACILYVRINNIKVLLSAVLLAVIVLNRSDVMFIMGFIAPIVCIFAAELFKKNRKTFIKSILVLFVLIALLRVIGIFYESIGQYFMKVKLSTPYGKVYGSNGFVDYDEIWSNISITLTEVMALFNIELSGYDIMSVNTLMSVLRIGIILTIVYTVLRSIVASFNKKKQNEYDYISLIAGYGFIFNILLVMFTKNGVNLGCSKYLTLTVFLGAVVLCRNTDRLIEKCNCDLECAKKVIFVFFCLCILIDASPVWTVNSYKADYEDIFSEVADTISYNKLGNGVGGYWYASNLTALSNGEYPVITGTLTGEGFDMTIPNVEINYIAQIKDSRWDMSYGWYTVDDLFRICGEPDRIWETDDYAIYYYEDGVLTIN